MPPPSGQNDVRQRSVPQPAAAGTTDDGTLTIAEAKARLARTFGVEPSNIKM